MNTFSSYSFGCRVNYAEIEAINKQLIQRGYRFDKVNPDVYIINTCSVTHKAEREAKALIYSLKRKIPGTKIVVTGCAATNWIKTNTKIKGIDYLIDNKNKDYVADLLEKKFFDQNRLPPKSHKKIDAIDRALITDKFLASKRVIVKIQDGCHRFCTFCIVPYLRGLPKSKTIQEIIQQIQAYKGYQEAVLTAINTEAFGRDTNEKFTDLIKEILKSTDIPRISFGSIHPWTLGEEFFTLYKELALSDRFVDFFHIPLQSGSDKMLNLMKRGYHRKEILEKLQTLKNINEFAQIGTDIIVGFLEESDTDFEDTLNFLSSSPITKIHVFRYSQREHTAAFYLGKRLHEPSDNIKKARSLKLRDLSQKKYQVFQHKHLNTSFEALFLEKREGEYQQAVLTNNMIALIKSEKDQTGEKKRVKINSCQNGFLVGKILD
jgi:threonylcarbamoyladenosine tRNA methylthiotransferase MtaB